MENISIKKKFDISEFQSDFEVVKSQLQNVIVKYGISDGITIKVQKSEIKSFIDVDEIT